MDKKQAVKTINRLKDQHDISRDELEQVKVEKESPSRGEMRIQRRQRLQRRRPVAVGLIQGNRPLLGIGSRGIFDDPTPFVGNKPILNNPGHGIFHDPTPFVGNRGKVISDGPAVTNSPVVGSGREVSDRIFRRRKR